MSERVDQLVAGYAGGDAISQEARIFRDILRKAGMQSDIFVPPERVAADMQSDCRPLSEYNPAESKAVILHYSTQSDVNALFAASTGRKILRYHNITPSDWYAGYDDAVAAELSAARAGLAEVVKEADSCWPVSGYNAGELQSLSPRDSRVLPLMFNPDEFQAGERAEPHPEFGGGLSNWLFVGRIAPHKRVEELIEAFAWYQTLNPLSRLIVVGSAASCPNYYAMLRLLASRLELPNVCFTGFVTNADRYRIYKAADIFVSASRHEGYCLPLVEAMALDVPVIARNIGGMPEAMDGAGVLFDGLSARELALLVDRVVRDDEARAEVLASQQKRMVAISTRRLSDELLELLFL